MHFITVYQLKIHPAELKCKRLSRLKWNFEMVSAVWTLQQHPDHHSFSGPDIFIVFSKGKKLYQNRAKITKIIRIKTTVKSHLFAVFSTSLIFLFYRWTRDGNQMNTFNFQKTMLHLKVSTSSFSINSSIKTCKLPHVKHIWKWKILNDKLTPESHFHRSCLTKRSFKNTRSVASTICNFK